MSGRTQGEKLDELGQFVATLTARLDSVQGEATDLTEKHDATRRELAALQTAVARVEQRLTEVDAIKAELAALGEQKVEIALLKRDVEELKKARDESGRRLWMLAAPIAGALVGVLVGYLLRG
jgi:chromosome segregation ATPase